MSYQKTDAWTYGSGPPSSKSHLKSEIIWNKDPGPGDPLAWVCTEAGKPGEWMPIATLPIYTNICVNDKCLQPDIVSDIGEVCVPGACPGDYVEASLSSDQPGVHVAGWVSSDNVVKYLLSNRNTDPVEIPSGEVTIKVTKK